MAEESGSMLAKTTPIPASVLRKQEWLGFQVMAAELGWVRAIGLGIRMKKQLASGAPWAELPAPETQREEWSRAQVGPAIVLFQLLLEMKHPAPLDLVRSVVVTGAVPWMQWAIGSIEPDVYKKMTADARESWFEGKRTKFLNMTLKSHEVGQEHVEFHVSSCSFPALCRDTGVPELAPVFCAVDAHYFGSVQKGIALDRPETLAAGGTQCSFHLAWVEEE